MNDDPASVDPAAAGPIPSDMDPADSQEVTQLLADWSQGSQAALEKLTPLVYAELRGLAHHYMI